MRAQHGISAADRELLRSFECGSLAIAEFHHREHVRLAYIILAQNDSRSGVGDSEAFMSAHPQLLDPAIMLTHYERHTLRSAQARASFVEPDLDPIPRWPMHVTGKDEPMESFKTFARIVGNATKALEFEKQVLGRSRDQLPDNALSVLDGGTPSSEYCMAHGPIHGYC